MDRRICLREAPKQDLQFIGRNADTGVAHLDAQMLHRVRVVLRRKSNGNTALGCELDGGVDQIDEHLTDVHFVAEMRRTHRVSSFDLEGQIFLMRNKGKACCYTLDELRQRERCGMKHHAARLEARE